MNRPNAMMRRGHGRSQLAHQTWY